MEPSQETVKSKQRSAHSIGEELDAEKYKKNAALQDLKILHLRTLLEKVKHDLTKEQELRVRQKKDLELKHAIVLKESTEFKHKFNVEKSLKLQKEDELKILRTVKKTNVKLNMDIVILNHRVQDLVGFKNFADKKMGEQNLALKNWEKQHIDLTKIIQEITNTSSQYKYQLDDLMQVNQKYETEKEKCNKLDKDLKKHTVQVEALRSQIREFKMTTKELTTKLKECSQSCSDLQDVVTKMRETEKNLMSDLDQQKKEAEKQRQLIARMEDELNNLGNLNAKLQSKERDMTKHSLTKDEEVQYVRNLICDSEGKQRLLLIEIETIKDEKKHVQHHLFKAQEELDQKKITNKKLREEVKILKTEADNNNEMLTKANQNNCSLNQQLKKVKLKLAETKKMFEELKKSNAYLMESIKLNEVIAEKEKFEKEVVRCNGMVEQLQMRLNLQDAAMVLLGKTIEDYEDEVRFLQLENKRLRDEIYIKYSKQRQAKVFSDLDINLRRKNLWFFKKKPVISAKNAEIAELRRRLARRPDGAIQKLQRCRWENRHLSKQLKVLKGQLVAYQELHKSVSEDNKKLTCAMKKMNLEFGSTLKHLPSISKTPQPPTEAAVVKSKDERRPASEQTHLPPMKSENRLITFTPFIPIFPPLPPPRSEYRPTRRRARFPTTRSVRST